MDNFKFPVLKCMREKSRFYDYYTFCLDLKCLTTEGIRINKKHHCCIIVVRFNLTKSHLKIRTK